MLPKYLGLIGRGQKKFFRTFSSSHAKYIAGLTVASTGMGLVLANKAECDNTIVASSLVEKVAVVAPPEVSIVAEDEKSKSLGEKIGEYFTYFKNGFRYLFRILTYLMYGTPLVVLGPLGLGYFEGLIGPLTPRYENMIWNYLIWAIQKLGPTFIKMAQWASTRPDLYPPILIEKMLRLQDDVEVEYKFDRVERTLAEAFGPDWNKVFELDPEPIGTGCVAQVYKGFLNENGKRTKVAVKMIHPNIDHLVHVDMELLSKFTRWLDTFPDLEMINLGETFTEFGNSMTAQLDLRQEAENLDTFTRNFKDADWCVFPKPISRFTRKNILVETFMEGTPIAHYMNMQETSDEAVDLKRKINDVCYRMLLKMIFFDNFIHGDLHPGNLFVQIDKIGRPKVVCLDCGIMFKSKTDEDHKRLTDICISFMKHDGRTAGRLMVAHSRLVKKTDKIDDFCEAMQQIVDDAEQQSYFEHISEYMQRICDNARIYQVKLDPGYFKLAMTLKVCEGISLALERELDLITSCLPIILKGKAMEKLGLKFPPPKGY